jgi:hypothetical protein
MRWWARYRVLLLLLLGLAALDGVVAVQRERWRAYDPDDYLERVNGCRGQVFDLVLVGGSTMSEGVDPAALAGLDWQGRPLTRTYNLGLPGATLSEIWEAVEHGLVKPPRLLIYGITASDLNDDRREPHGPRSLMSVRDVADWARYRPKTAEWAVRQFVEGRLEQVWQLYRYRNGIRLWAADQLEQLLPGTCSETAATARFQRRYAAAMCAGNGFAPHEGFQHSCYAQLKTCVNLASCFPYLHDFRIGEYLNYLHRLLDWADAHHVEVVLVDMPVSGDLEERLYPQAFAGFRAALAEVERSRGVRVLHASRQVVGLEDANFADLIHLNASGTALLSGWLRKTLKEERLCRSVGSCFADGPAIGFEQSLRRRRSETVRLLADLPVLCLPTPGRPRAGSGSATAGSTKETGAWAETGRGVAGWP